MFMEIIGNCSNKYKSRFVRSLSLSRCVCTFFCVSHVHCANMWKLIQYNLLPISESIFTTDIHIRMRKWRSWCKPKSTIPTHWIIFSRLAHSPNPTKHASERRQANAGIESKRGEVWNENKCNNKAIKHNHFYISLQFIYCCRLSCGRHSSIVCF